MNERLTDRKWRSERLRCLLWGFVPIFDFFAFLLMADNSGQDKYRRKGLAFAAITMTAFFIIVSGDILIYFTTIGMGLRAEYYVRSLIVVAMITLPISYLMQLILIGLTRKEYLAECAYMEEAFGAEAEEKLNVESTEKETCRIDLNTCTKEELQKLPGIDAAMAIRIADDRAEYGDFSSVDEFIDRYGIKPHFAVRIMETAYVSADMSGAVGARADGRTSAGKPFRALDF